MPLRPLAHNLLKSEAQVAKLSAFPTASESDASLLPEPDYFDTIDKLIAWKSDNISRDGLDAVQVSVHDTVPATRKLDAHFTLARNIKPRLLVCHDFKGGYTEDPFERGYSFEFWHLVDTFIYFSHKRITLPPRGWVDAGHRHGSKVLGTVIFEWEESKPGLGKCLYGPLLQPPASGEPDMEPLPFSTICISQLIRLAKERNFDGYLINIETDLNFLPPASCYPDKSQKERDDDAAFMEREQNLAGLEAFISSTVQHRRKLRMKSNASVVSRWVGWLREEGKRIIGAHWEVIWYDSVTEDGKLRWQDALTKANAPFFKNSDAIFTNYTWARPPDPVPPGGLPEPPRPPFEHHPALLKSALMAQSMSRSSTDVYMGIDVFGRNCYGGYEVGRSLDLIFPSRNQVHAKGLDLSDSRTDGPDGQEDLGLSVALFAPGWTWEREKEDGSERSWSEWWVDDLRFWFGRTTTMEIPDGSSGEVHGISRYFGPRLRHLPSVLSSSGSQSDSLLETRNTSLSLPTGDSLPEERGSIGHGAAPPTFYTNFNCGSGTSWWVYGRKVHDASSRPQPEDPAGQLGWTDIGSCFPKPDRIWPRLVPLHLDDRGTTQSANSIRMLDRTPRGKWMIDRAGLIDYEVWQGGSSLEVVFRPRQSTGTDEPIHVPTHSCLTVLPLCTLNAHHISSPPQEISLEVVVRAFPDQVENFDPRDLQVRPYVIWASDELSEECSYHISVSSSGSAMFSQLDNGWYSSRTTLHLTDLDTVELAAAGAVVPVVGLRIHFPQLLPLGDLRILVGEISVCSLPPSRPVPAPFSHSVPATAVTRSSTGTLCWKRVPAPSAASPTSLWGILTWDDEEDSRKDGLPSSGYFNVFAFPRKTTKTSCDQYHDVLEESHIWLGTSTYEHNPNSFVVAGLEPLDIIGSNRPKEQLTSITFGVHKIGVTGRAKNEGRESSYSVEGRQELEVSLLT